jgi:hypothetical protein
MTYGRKPTHDQRRRGARRRQASALLPQSSAFFAVPSFQEGSGLGPWANAIPTQTTSAISTELSLLIQFTSFHPLKWAKALR